MKLTNALFWDVAECPIYLLATVHGGPVGGYQFPAFADAIMSSQDAAYFELDPFGQRDMSFMLRTQQSPTLAEELGDALYRRLVAERLPLQSHPIDALAAGGVADVLQFVANAKRPLKYTQEWGVDRAVCSRYMCETKFVRYLETDLLQGRAAIKGPLSEIVAELDAWHATGSLPRIDEELVMMAYETADMNALAKFRNEMCPLRPTRARAMLAEREIRWVEKINEIKVTGQRTLVAVGALHFPGDDGLLAQLRRANYTVRYLGGC